MTTWKEVHDGRFESERGVVKRVEGKWWFYCDFDDRREIGPFETKEVAFDRAERLKRLDELPEGCWPKRESQP